MNETKFTPGPWRIGDHGDDVVSESSENISDDIVAEAPKDWHDSYEYWPANAKLIAAAPELLEALRLALPYIEGAYECAFPDSDRNENVLEAAKAAIAKATT